MQGEIELSDEAKHNLELLLADALAWSRLSAAEKAALRPPRKRIRAEAKHQPARLPARGASA